MIVQPNHCLLESSYRPSRAKTRPKLRHSPWRAGIVTDKVTPRSYLVEMDGRRYRCNRIHLRDAPDIEQAQETWPSIPAEVDTPTMTIGEVARQTSNTAPPEDPTNTTGPRAGPANTTVTPVSQTMSAPPSCRKRTKEPSATPSAAPTVTRVGRVSKTPKRLQDYM